MRGQLDSVLASMQEAIDRARIRDSARIRAHKLALAVALTAPAVLANPKIPHEHTQVVREILAECRALVVGARVGEHPETFLEGIPREDVLAVIRSEVEAEIAGTS